MASLILSTATRFVLPLLLLYSIFVLLRGHNAPGGGFVGGLVAAAAFVLYAFSFRLKRARNAIRIDPRIYIGVGLLIAVGSAAISLFQGLPFMTGRWTENPIPILGKLGTPVLFDVGVYFVVLGVTLTIIFSLADER